MKRKTLRFMSFVRRHLNLINKIIEDRKEEKRLDYQKVEGECKKLRNVGNFFFFFFLGNSANNDENVVYNDQPYFLEPIEDNQNFGLDD